MTYTSASAVVFATAVAVVIVHKKKNYENDEPQNCAALAITTVVSK